MECEFNNPVNFKGEPPKKDEPFQFKYVSCPDDDVLEYIQNPSANTDFYIDKTISYGDTILITLFTIFIIFWVFKVVWNFVLSDNKGKL